jgi:hypothetical protein
MHAGYSPPPTWTRVFSVNTPRVHHSFRLLCAATKLTWPQQCRINQVRPARCCQYCHPAQPLHTIQLSQQLVHNPGAGQQQQQQQQKELLTSYESNSLSGCTASNHPTIACMSRHVQCVHKTTWYSAYTAQPDTARTHIHAAQVRTQHSCIQRARIHP